MHESSWEAGGMPACDASTIAADDCRTIAAERIVGNAASAVALTARRGNNG
jgi:hypothetical protein